jgi:hypothetical protein
LTSSYKFDLTLIEPEKKVDYVKQACYRLVTTLGNQAPVTVLRTVSDFVWLRDRLVKKYRGCLIPLVPESVLGFYVNTSIGDKTSEHCRALRKFLARVTAHPELSQSSDLDAFLRAEEGPFNKLKDEKEEKASRSIVKSIKESVHNVQSRIGMHKEREKSNDDVACDKVMIYAAALETCLNSVQTNSEYLFKTVKGLSAAWSEFGMSFARLGIFETKQNEPHLGTALSLLGNCAEFLHNSMLNHSVDNETLMDGLRDYLVLVKSVQALLKNRNTLLTSCHFSLSTLESEQAALAKLQGQPGKEDKALAQDKVVIEAQAQVDREKADLHDVTQQCLAEIQRFQKEKYADMKALVAHFCTLQMDHTKKLHTAWSNCLKEVNALP